MFTEERRQAILALLRKESPMAVNELIERIEGSPATIRRDLTFLEMNGYITRSRGCARYIQPESPQHIAFSEEILRLASAAAKLVHDDDTIMLDSGACTLALAHRLTDKKNLTIVTNSLSVANALSMSSITTHLTGGMVSGREEALVGVNAERSIREMRAPLLFLATTGIRGLVGLSCVTPFQAAVKQAFIESADRVVLLLEQSKISVDALIVFANFKDIDCIIVDKPLEDENLRAYLEKLGTEIIIASN